MLDLVESSGIVVDCNPIHSPSHSIGEGETAVTAKNTILDTVISESVRHGCRVFVLVKF